MSDEISPARLAGFKDVPPLVIPGIKAEIEKSGINIWDTVLGDGDCLACLQSYDTALALHKWLGDALGITEGRGPLPQCNCKAGAWDTHDDTCPLAASPTSAATEGTET
jgi:hypothetical protein